MFMVDCVLVTGGCGYIGSHTVLALLEQGYIVYIIDSHKNSNALVIKRLLDIFNSKNINLFQKLHHFKGDVRSALDLENVFKKAKNNGQEINAVIHFAGLKSVKDSFKDPLSYWDNNLNGTINLLKIMRKFSCKTLIFSSSATIYFNAQKKFIKEDHFINPINPYGRTKATVEILLKDIYESEVNDWRIINLRYFNPIGAHCSGKIGENPIGIPNNIFPLILKVASKKMNELKVYGNDWNTKDGTCIRDFIHVMDLAEGHVSALNYLEKNPAQILNLNIGTGVGNSVLDLIHIFQEANKINIPYSFTKRREGDQEFVVADNSKILSIFNWKPKRTIENMCKDGWKWQVNNQNGY